MSAIAEPLWPPKGPNAPPESTASAAAVARAMIGVADLGAGVKFELVATAAVDG